VQINHRKIQKKNPFLVNSCLLYIQQAGIARQLKAEPAKNAEKLLRNGGGECKIENEK